MSKNDTKKSFEKDGYLEGFDVLDASEIQEMKAKFKSLEDEFGKQNTEYSLHNTHVQYPWVMKAATHPKLLEQLTKILGPDIILLDSRFICKYSADELPSTVGEKFVAWHQDVRYWGVEYDVITVWMAVDDADEENGALHVVPETHKLGLLVHNKAERKGNMLSRNQEIQRDIYDVNQSTPCYLKAGQATLFHGLTIHGSPPNRSNRRRCGFIIRYLATKTKKIEDPDRPKKFDQTVLVSGTDSYKNFEDKTPEWFINKQIVS